MVDDHDPSEKRRHAIAKLAGLGFTSIHSSTEAQDWILFCRPQVVVTGLSNLNLVGMGLKCGFR